MLMLPQSQPKLRCVTLALRSRLDHLQQESRERDSLVAVGVGVLASAGNPPKATARQKQTAGPLTLGSTVD